MTIQIYKTGGLVSRSCRKAKLVTEVEVEPCELPYDLSRFAKRHGGDFAEVVQNNSLFEELQTA